MPSPCPLVKFSLPLLMLQGLFSELLVLILRTPWGSFYTSPFIDERIEKDRVRDLTKLTYRVNSGYNMVVTLKYYIRVWSTCLIFLFYRILNTVVFGWAFGDCEVATKRLCELMPARLLRPGWLNTPVHLQQIWLASLISNPIHSQKYSRFNNKWYGYI